jgi:hypothetical protein
MNLLDLPAFLWLVFVLYWSLPVACLTGYIKWWQLWGKRNDAIGW